VLCSLALLVEEGRTRQCRGQVVLRRFKPDHPVASRHPSSSRRGACCVHLPSSLRRAGRDSVADRWSCGASNPTTPSLRATPSRRGGERVVFTLPSSLRRAGRDSVADRWSCGASNPTTPSLRATPSRRGGERVVFTLPSSLRRAGRDSVADRWSCGV